jgi:hypothetical protein
MRLATSFNPQVSAFVASGRTSDIVTIKPNKEQVPAFEKHSLPIKSFQLRLIRVCLPSGLIEVLATNLLDEARHPAADFAELYHRRWRIEEAFRHIKCRLQLEQFGGETPLAIRQEFHATILLHNLATLAGMDALAQREGAEVQTHGANLARASHLIRQHLPRLLACPEERAALCSLILERIAKKITRRRLGRQGPPRKPDREKPHPNRAYK